MTTECVNCGLVLTSKDGKRLHSANFTTELPSIQTANVTWARCDACHDFALARLDYFNELARIEAMQEQK